MIIQVFNSGCPNCKQLYELTKKVAAELKLDSEVEYIADAAKMVELGVLTGPVLAIDGQPILTGRGHDEKSIKNALELGLAKGEKKCCGGCGNGGCC
jgi:small redox-active disulfide protein 2